MISSPGGPKHDETLALPLRTVPKYCQFIWYFRQVFTKVKTNIALSNEYAMECIATERPRKFRFWIVETLHFRALNTLLPANSYK